MEFLTADEIARRLKVDVSTVRGWCRSGQLPAVRVGRQYRITEADYTAFLKSREVPPATTSAAGALFA